jgi:hypothetical protein
MRLQVVADRAGSKHAGDSRNRGKGGQPVWRSRRPIVEGMEMRTFGDLRGGVCSRSWDLLPSSRGSAVACGRSQSWEAVGKWNARSPMWEMEALRRRLLRMPSHPGREIGSIRGNAAHYL